MLAIGMNLVMDSQTIINSAFAVIGALGGWVLNRIWEALKDLHAADKVLTEKVGAIEVLVAGVYVTREELQKTVSAVFTKLDRIEDKLDHKVDKGN